MAMKDLLRRALDAIKPPAKRGAKGPASGAKERERPRTPTGHAEPKPAGHAPSADIADLAGITITYAPQPGREADPGEVVWTWVPYEDDPCQGKDRPVVLFGRRKGDLVGVALTTKDDHPHQVLVGTGAWDQAGRPSYAKLERILEVDSTRVRRVGGVLDKHRFDDLIVALRKFYAD